MLQFLKFFHFSHIPMEGSFKDMYIHLKSGTPDEWDTDTSPGIGQSGRPPPAEGARWENLLHALYAEKERETEQKSRKEERGKESKAIVIVGVLYLLKLMKVSQSCLPLGSS